MAKAVRYALGVVLVLLMVFLVSWFCATSLLLWRYFVNTWADRPARHTDFGAALDGLGTGDLLLFDYGGLSSRLLTGAPFSHVGIVIRGRDGVARLSETGAPAVPPFYAAEASAARWLRELQSSTGVHCLPVWPRLKHYKGQVYLARLRRPLEPAQEEALRAAAAAAEDVPYPSDALSLFQKLSGWGASPARECFEHVLYLLGSAGVVPAEAPAAREAGAPVVLSGLAPRFGACRAVCALPGGPAYQEPERLVV